MLRSISDLLFTMLFLYFSIQLVGQTNDDFTFARHLLDQDFAQSTIETYAEEVSKNKNEVDFIFSGLFLVYKDFFSSQDHSRCSFHPSCSVYAIQNIKANGMVKGGVLALDRLMRCNSLSPEKYEIDFENRILLDPVKVK